MSNNTNDPTKQNEVESLEICYFCNITTISIIGVAKYTA